MSSIPAVKVVYVRCVLLRNGLDEKPHHKVQLKALPAVREHFVPHCPLGASLVRDQVVVEKERLPCEIYECLLLEPSKMESWRVRDLEDGFVNSHGDFQHYWRGAGDRERAWHQLVEKIRYQDEQVLRRSTTPSVQINSNRKLTHGQAAADHNAEHKKALGNRPKSTPVLRLGALAEWFKCSHCNELQHPEKKGYTRWCCGDLDGTEPNYPDLAPPLMCIACSDEVFKCNRCNQYSLDDGGWCTTSMCDPQLY